MYTNYSSKVIHFCLEKVMMGTGIEKKGWADSKSFNLPSKKLPWKI